MFAPTGNWYIFSCDFINICKSNLGNFNSLVAGSMEVPKDLSAENVTFSKEKNILNDIAQETKDSPGYGALTEDELMEKVETILLEKIKEGEKQAYFQLGLFYYEQVQNKNWI